MKYPSTRPALALALTFLLQPASFLLAQGSLTPPGAPAPTMKTLDQVEARTPIGSAPFTIVTSGSYYLTANLTVTSGVAIVINVDDTTLDLNGFTISSTASPASGAGVVINGVRRNVTVRNGRIKGTTTFASGTFTTGGFGTGISASVDSTNLRVSEVDVQGVSSAGIDLGADDNASLSVERCQVAVCGGKGIRAGTVRDCGVETSGLTGIFAGTVRSSFANVVGASEDGIECSTVESSTAQAPGNAISASNAINCKGTSTAGGTGLSATHATNCQGFSPTGTGLSATNAMNCTGFSSAGIGLQAANATNCVGTSVSGSFGMVVSGTAHSCRAARSGGVALNAGIAIGCTAVGSVTSSNKFLGTP